MLTAHAHDGNVSGLNVDGDLIEVVTDIGSIIEAVASALRRACPEAETEFREMLHLGRVAAVGRQMADYQRERPRGIV